MIIQSIQRSASARALRSSGQRLPAACRAGLWLAFDYLDESHEISQGLPTAEGSYWHAILHRREPDAANSNYWWRRVGDHPVFAQLAGVAVELAYPMADVSDAAAATEVI